MTRRPTPSGSAPSPPGTVALSLGTSGVVFATTDAAAVRAGRARPCLLPRRARALAHDVGDALGGGEPALVPRRAGARHRSTTTCWRGAAEVPAGSDGLIFLPYLTGERTPHPDPLARGAFVGLTVGHDRRHLTRAVLEGVAYGLRDGLDLMVAAGIAAPSQIRASGGGIAQRAVAPDPGRRARCRDRHGENHRGRRLRRGPAGGGRRPAGSPTVDDGDGRAGDGHAGGGARAGCGAYAEGHARYRALYPALAPTSTAAERAPSAGRGSRSSASSSRGCLVRLLAEDDHGRARRRA